MKSAWIKGFDVNFNKAIEGMKKIPNIGSDAWINKEGTKIVVLKWVNDDYYPTYCWLETDTSTDKSYNNAGYKLVSINTKMYLLHRLVATTWVDNPNHYNEVDHIDSNKKNNSAANLEWVTRKENMKRYYDKRRNSK